jgi:ectoine hydroxylase-related dioxygenase (phytanoyl-CoA dioxygenase family)
MKSRPSFLCALFWLLHLSLAILLCTSAFLYYIRQYYAPTLLWEPVGGEVERDVCETGPSTENLEDIQISKSFSREQAADVMKEHGAGIVESVLTKETAADLRTYIMKVNNESAVYYVHSPANRHHIALDIKTPIVRQAMKEIGEHPVMRPLIDDLMGPAASLVTLAVITNYYGAIDQHWHRDCDGAELYPDDFVYEYALGIPLQDTTREMGATGMCFGV